MDAVQRKARGEIRKVVVTGCLSQRYARELTEEIPEVDSFLGIQSASQISDAVFGVSSARGGATVLPMLGSMDGGSRNQVPPCATITL